jgi:glutamate--cysteine ligase
MRTTTAARRALRDALFVSSFAPQTEESRLVGAEFELLALDADSRRPVPLHSGERSLTTILRTVGREAGWREYAAHDGTPRFDVPATGTISFEPGGQIELSSRAFASPSALIGSVTTSVQALSSRLRAEGIALTSVGIDPQNDARDIPLQLDVDRYRRMTAHFESIGPFGIRMMRQTAAIQVSVDRGALPDARWRLLNDLAPYLTAIFANSPRYRGEQTGHRSFRAHCWRQLDPTRTGLAEVCDDPADAYVRFALGASDILGQGWEPHLTTLFPEVRPRGHFEVRSCDAIDPAWYAVPIVLVSALAYDPLAASEASRLAAKGRALLALAGERGLRDESLARTCRDLFRLALDGARRLGEKYIGGEALAVAAEYYRTYTARGQSPADDDA